MIRVLLVLILLAGPLNAQTLRIAVWNVGLSRDGPGLVLADIQKDSAEIAAIVATLTVIQADILLLVDVDGDYAGLAMGALAAQLPPYETQLQLLGNEGQPSGLDLDGDGRLNGWNDNWGFGKFPGNGAMVLLARAPVIGVRSWNNFIWTGEQGPDRVALRLSSHGHWDVTLQTTLGPLHLLISNPTPPVFDGPDDRNGRRNDAEIAFWLDYLNGALLGDDAGNDAPLDTQPFVLLGDLNADPARGDGLGHALRALLAHPRIQDPPQLHQPTAYWAGLPAMRVDYILPDSALSVQDAGVLGAVDGVQTAHRLVWLDLR